MERNISAKALDQHLSSFNIDTLQEEIEKYTGDQRAAICKLIEKYRKKIERFKKEQERLVQMNQYEDQLHKLGIEYVAGVDEAGRGPLAGPVFAAAVIFPKGTRIEGINDSKKINEKKREELYDIIIEKAISYSIQSVDEKEIDNINILNAAHQAMVKAVQALHTQPQHVLIDGNPVTVMPLPNTCIVKGDSKSISIAAASILAKVTRDRYILRLAETYPQYGFEKNKGYGTPDHIEAIKKNGLCPIHRITFTKKFV